MKKKIIGSILFLFFIVVAFILTPTIEKEIFIFKNKGQELDRQSYNKGRKIYNDETFLSDLTYTGLLTGDWLESSRKKVWKKLEKYEQQTVKALLDDNKYKEAREFLAVAIVGIESESIAAFSKQYEYNFILSLMTDEKYTEARSFAANTIVGSDDKKVQALFLKFSFLEDLAKTDSKNYQEAKGCFLNNDLQCLALIGRKHQLIEMENIVLAKKYYRFVQQQEGELNLFQTTFLNIIDPEPVNLDDIKIDYSYNEECANCISTEIVAFEYKSWDPDYCYIRAKETLGIKKIRSLFLWVGIEQREQYTHIINLLDLHIRASGNFAMLGAGETTTVSIADPDVTWTTTRRQIKNTGKGLLKARMACAASWAEQEYVKLKENGSEKPADYLSIVEKTGLISRASVSAAYTAFLLSDEKEKVLKVIGSHKNILTQDIVKQSKQLDLDADQDYSRSNALANAFVDAMSALCKNGGCVAAHPEKDRESKATCEAVQVLAGKSAGGAKGACFMEGESSLAKWRCMMDYMSNKGKTYGAASGACWIDSGSVKYTM